MSAAAPSLRRPRPPRTRAAALAALGVLVTALAGWFGVAPAPARGDTSSASGSGVTMRVLDVSPNSPIIDNKSRRLAIVLQLTNDTAQALHHVTISADRSDPIQSQSALNQAIAAPRAPSSGLVAPLHATVQIATVAPGATTEVTYRTTTDTANDSDLCLCADAIYPIYLRASTAGADGTTVQLATTQTYLPSFMAPPTKETVAWVWPLLDRPHRLRSDTVFTDDQLTGEVSPGGRLDRLLSVAEQVGQAGVPLTIVTDPDLIDSLAVMAKGYRVQEGSTTVAGTGGPMAAAWLLRLRTLLQNDPSIELSMTAPADPAIASLTAHGLSWQSSLSSAATSRVAEALGVPTRHDIAWPAGETADVPALGRLVQQGAHTVLLNDRTLPLGSTDRIVPDAVARLRTSAGPVKAAVVSTTLDHWVATVLDPATDGGKGLAALPELIAQLALRPVLGSLSSPPESHFAVLAPPRDLALDSVSLAVRTILSTARSPWSTPIGLRDAVATINPVNHGAVHRQPGPQLPAKAISDLRYVASSLPGLRSLFKNAADRVAVVGNLPMAAQRSASSSLLAAPSVADADAAQLRIAVQQTRTGVQLVQPNGTGTYTLTSQTSQLPVTIRNRLGQDVVVRLHVWTTPAGPGLTADDLTRTVSANSRVQVHLRAHVDRVGRFQVHVSISTVNGMGLGPSIHLVVRSTALGTLGVVITLAAGVVLLVALLVRLVRRLRRGHRRPPPPGSGRDVRLEVNA